MYKPLGIIFDLGDTVLHLKSFDVMAGNRRLLEFAENNPGVTAEEVQKVADEMKSWINIARDEAMIEFSGQSYYRLLFETLGVKFKTSFAELEKEFWRAACTYVPDKGLYKLLDTLEARGIITGILSNTINSAVVFEDELARHDLAHRFSFVMTSADYGVRKPHHYIFRVAIKKMGLNPADIWYVGDRPEYDIRGALDAGLYPVWYNWREEPGTIDGDYLEVGELGQLREIIEQLYST